METLQLVCLQWISEEREKHIWEDLYSRPWDEVIGRMYVLKAHHTMARCGYEAALADFEDGDRVEQRSPRCIGVVQYLPLSKEMPTFLF